jgi:hypothetical protein
MRTRQEWLRSWQCVCPNGCSFCYGWQFTPIDGVRQLKGTRMVIYYDGHKYTPPSPEESHGD